jgi:hypothetical protein
MVIRTMEVVAGGVEESIAAPGIAHESNDTVSGSCSLQKFTDFSGFPVRGTSGERFLNYIGE